MSVIDVKGIQKHFGEVKALRNVDLSVNKGEIYGFIGPNGAGKSTTIRILLGLLQADAGEARIFEQDVWEDAVSIHKRIAYVPGDVNLWPNLTGGEVIDLFLSMRGVTVDQEKKHELMKRFNFDPSKKCRTYSKGNRQKVALIAAFSADAEVYILDEPTSGLDPLMERVFQECVFEARDRGCSVLLSSHILSEVERLCDRVAIIRDGEIIESGSLKDLRHLTRVQLLVETKKEIPDLANQTGVYDLAEENGTYRFQVDTDQLDVLIRYVSEFGVIKLESAPPTLEDLFMRHYEDNPDKGEDS
ncbi:ABC-2 type transport system ATP-binding protein [Pelagirhabdus alkalitolerans]|uniref:ABC-2 type transport system ATP-binding protein n=1 Tax=Pelagirhabdus alkalitolerans TaxID=1612202 RepID=A0A1G6JR02_9BACI|nr:ABC transporter ATP-binding protein [Pelagirhabdus alkalitolerans]SDC20416.1 ABC-2 type transport system ATP-binding protein [Pelagirhabdus alkalitolerans]